jgi:hypothetical protein
VKNSTNARYQPRPKAVGCMPGLDGRCFLDAIVLIDERLEHHDQPTEPAPAAREGVLVASFVLRIRFRRRTDDVQAHEAQEAAIRYSDDALDR